MKVIQHMHKLSTKLQMVVKLIQSNCKPKWINLSIAGGATNTDLTVLVEHGSKITWRVNGSQVSG